MYQDEKSSEELREEAERDRMHADGLDDAADKKADGEDAEQVAREKKAADEEDGAD